MCLSEGERGMALEAVVYPQTQLQLQVDPFCGGGYYGSSIKDFYNYNLLQQPPSDDVGGGSYEEEDFNHQLLVKEEGEGEGSLTTFLQNNNNNYHPYGDWNIDHDTNNINGSSSTTSMLLPTPPQLSNDQETSTDHPQSNTVVRPKRRRARSRKNKEEIENQRITHIAVERNRRKQMNDYLSVLRSLMPESYVQRGDQASIIGGAINFVKELEHKMHFLGAHKKQQPQEGKSDDAVSVNNNNNNKPFSEFFSFPQYSTTSASASASNGTCENSAAAATTIVVGEIHSAGIADIEVTMVESHANLKIRSQKRPKQLLKMVSGLHNMRLTILHLNVTTTAQFVLYSLSVKVEEDCKLGTVDDIAAAVYQMLNRRIQEEARQC